MINEQLSDPVQCKSDETIAAIISLANFEVSNYHLLRRGLLKEDSVLLVIHHP
jgi:hypothetical protein